MERLDKLLASTGRWSRREVKVLVKEGRVLVDGVPAARAEDKADPAASRIQVDGEEAVIRAYTYVMLNKPAGVLSATEDPRQETVLDLLSPELRRQGLSPVGRLDKDTEGLLLLTNDRPAPDGGGRRRLRRGPRPGGWHGLPSGGAGGPGGRH